MSVTRREWLVWMEKIAGPVVRAAADGTLAGVLPSAFHQERAQYFAPLEAFGRTACGIAPWLEAQGLEAQEEALRCQWTAWMLAGIDRATDVEAGTALRFSGEHGGQPLVDAAFLCHALLRAPNALAGALSDSIRARLIACLKQTRDIVPPPNNWLLFSAMVEAGLRVLGDTDVRLDVVLHGLNSMLAWYKGDGMYGDGADFHWDYYNSFVIQPMMVDLARLFADVPEIAAMRPDIDRRAQRYAQILERMIAPDGSYPIIGRSVVYRFGAFQMLAQAALEDMLPPDVLPAQVRCALTAVMRRTMAAPSLFDAGGWLNPGLYGLQPSLAEGYINVGSLYLCTAAFLPLGLPPEHVFWAGEEMKWSAVKAWSGEDMMADHAIRG